MPSIQAEICECYLVDGALRVAQRDVQEIVGRDAIGGGRVRKGAVHEGGARNAAVPVVEQRVFISQGGAAGPGAQQRVRK